jgi:ribonuclease P protein 1
MLTYHEVNSLCYREIPFGLNMNKASKNPLPVYIVNFDRGCNKCKILHKAYPNLFNPDFPAVVTEKSYLDLFPPERLVYLTPDSRTDLCDYDADDVYIVGGIVEMANDVPYTLSKAKKQGIRHARLPIKRTVGYRNNIFKSNRIISQIISYPKT